MKVCVKPFQLRDWPCLHIHKSLCGALLGCRDSRQSVLNLGLAPPAKSPCVGLGWTETLSRSRKADHGAILGPIDCQSSDRRSGSPATHTSAKGSTSLPPMSSHSKKSTP